MYRLISLFLVLGFSASIIQAQQTHIVDLAGTGDFDTIHAAVDAAATGDTIRVQPDQYAFTAALGPIEVTKRLVIIGSGYMPVEDGGTELIDIPGTGFFDLTGSADGTVIKGFRVQGATDFLDTETGTSGVTIEENLFITGSSILVFEGTADTVRSNIFVSGGHTAVGTSGSNTQVTNNLFSSFNNAGAWNTGVVNITTGTGVVVAYNLFVQGQISGNGSGQLRITNGAPEVYSNGFVNNLSNTIYNIGTPFITNNAFYSATAGGLNSIDDSPSFENFDSDNATLLIADIDEDSYDLNLASGSAWINAGRSGTPYLDTDGSRSDIGLYAGPTPFSDGRGAPSVPVVIQLQVTPTTVSPSGTITITATGRIGDGNN